MPHWLWCVCKRLLRREGPLGLGMLGALACGSDAAGPTPPTAQDLFFSFAFQWPAVNLALTAPYDTAQLVAIPRTATGAVLTDTRGVPAVVHYTTTDSAVQVSATGLVTAHSVTAGARVIARLTVGGVTRTDTAIVQVTETPLPAPLATLSIQPSAGGVAVAHANLATNVLTTIPFVATIATGDPVTDTICTAMNGCTSPLLVHYASSDSTIAAIDQYGQVRPVHAGRVLVTISTLAYGVHKVDSLPVSIGYQLQATTEITIDSSQHPPVVSVPTLTAHRTTPFSVGVQLAVSNYTNETFLVTLPISAHGVHFIDLPDYTDNNPDPTQAVDTLPAGIADPFRNVVYVQFDSAGTYTLQYRGMQTRVTFSDTLTILPYP